MKDIRKLLRRPAGWMILIMLLGAGAAVTQVEWDRSAQSSPGAEVEVQVEDSRMAGRG
jgi:hypothetical protein